MCFYGPEPLVTDKIMLMLRDELESIIQDESRVDFVFFEDLTPFTKTALDTILALKENYLEKKIHILATIDPIQFIDEFPQNLDDSRPSKKKIRYRKSMENSKIIYGIDRRNINWITYAPIYNGPEERNGTVELHHEKFSHGVMLTCDLLITYYYRELIDVGFAAEKSMTRLKNKESKRIKHHTTIEHFYDQDVIDIIDDKIDLMGEPYKTLFLNRIEGKSYQETGLEVGYTYKTVREKTEKIGNQLRAFIEEKFKTT